LHLKPKFESSPSYSSFKRLVPGSFNLGLIGQPAPPYHDKVVPHLRDGAAHLQGLTLVHFSAQLERF
jgi:hypothetical protein